MSKHASPETQADATRVAKATQRPGQTKAQTKAIIQGIEKGIAEYKKQEKAKARERDKARKKAQRQQDAEPVTTAVEPDRSKRFVQWLPWGLLVISWLGFATYWFLV